MTAVVESVAVRCTLLSATEVTVIVAVSTWPSAAPAGTLTRTQTGRVSFELRLVAWAIAVTVPLSSAITAAVVGVVLNLAVWFALNALFPNHGALDWFALGLTIVALVGMLKWKWDVIPVVLGAGLVGLLYRTLV